MSVRKSIVCVLFLTAVAILADQSGLFTALKTTAALGRHEEGFYLLPTNQVIRPAGDQSMIFGRPVDMAFDSQKHLLAILNWRSVMLLDATGNKIAEIPSRSTSYLGVAFRPGDRELWASETTRNGPDSILIAKLSDAGKSPETSRISLKGHPLPACIAFSQDGKTAYVAFSRNNTLAVIDATTHEIVREVEVGIAPFGVAVSPARGKIFVTNRGGRRPRPGDTTAPSSGTAVVTDPVTGSSTTGTLSVIDVNSFAVRELPVGLAPSQLALSADEKLLAVTNSHSDSVSIIDTETLATSELKIPTFPEAPLGSQPIAVAFTPDANTLYVACGGNNAIAVARRSGAHWTIAGAMPTAWFPSAIATDPDSALRVLNLKGVGNTSNQKGNYNSKQYEGSLQRIPLPTPEQLAEGTRTVRAANTPQYEPAGGIRNLPSLGIQHVFLIIKENRTYDGVLGDLGKGNSDPKLCMYGRDITPNHHALAERYVDLDNFYTAGAISFDGHQWLEQAFVSDYVERAFASSPRGYAWNMADSLVVAPTGFFWQSASKPLDVRIFGEFQLPARWDPNKQNAVDMDEKDLLTWQEYLRLWREGKWQTAVGARSGVPALQPYCSRRYPQNSLSLPDQIRAEEFLREFAEHEKSGKLANLTILTLNSDHTNGTRPGTPTPRAMVGDNDLALGRIVEGITKSRFWPHSLILVTEDDAQDGLDHVDGHRTLALAISPYVRRNVVDSNNYNHVSLIRTIQEIFRIPQRTRYLVAARAMTSIFTAETDVTPYDHLTPNQSIDEMNPPLKALSGPRLWAARESQKMNFKDLDDAPEDLLNHILWWDAKGYDTPYPALHSQR
jgi:YVTN family beta-propeller protein